MEQCEITKLLSSDEELLRQGVAIFQILGVLSQRPRAVRKLFHHDHILLDCPGLLMGRGQQLIGREGCVHLCMVMFLIFFEAIGGTWGHQRAGKGFGQKA